MSKDPEDWGSITPEAVRIAELEAEVADLRQKLRRCFKGETLSVRNELVIEAIHNHTLKGAIRDCHG